MMKSQKCQNLDAIQSLLKLHSQHIIIEPKSGGENSIPGPSQPIHLPPSMPFAYACFLDPPPTPIPSSLGPYQSYYLYQPP